ncbi:tyrosine-type recombinase/integrase [Chloroflexota bacterium]
METSNLALENLIQGFRLSCQAEGKSPKTVEWYTGFLMRFMRFLESNGFPVTLNIISRDNIRAFILYLQAEARTPHKGKPLSGFTIQGYVRTLKSFFSWAVREGYIESNMMAGVPVPKAPVKIINSFTPEQIARLAAVCQRENGIGHRNLAMLLLMLDCGLRVSEMVNLDLGDVNLAEGYIRVSSGKGGKERVVPVGSVVQKVLWKYIHHFRPQPISNKITRLFLSCDGLPLTRNGIQQMLRRCGKDASITGVRCSPHTLRHTFAKTYLMNGGDIFHFRGYWGTQS